MMERNLTVTVIILSIITILSAVFLKLIDSAKDNFIVSIIYVLVISSFSIYYFLKDSKSEGIKALIAVSIFAYFIENIGIITSFPYGDFVYTDRMGPKIFHTPLTLALAFVPLVIAAYTLTYKIKKNAFRVGAMTGILLLFDLVIDPGAVVLGMWIWENPGIYYGIPLTNFFGWIFTGIIVSAMTVLILNKKKVSKYSTLTAFFLMLFYTSVCVLNNMIVPGAIGFTIIVYLSIKLFKN